MGRTERRANASKEKKENDKRIKAMRWVYSLPPEKQELIKLVADSISRNENKYFISSFDICTKAAMIDIANLDIEVIEKSIVYITELLEEHATIIKKCKDECGGDFEMAVKKISAKGAEVEALITELLNKGIADKEIKEIVAAEFPMVSKAMITNAVKKVKTNFAKERKAEVEKAIEKGSKVNDIVKSLGDPDVDTKEAVEYIFEDKKVNEDYAPAEELTVAELEEHIKDDEFEVLNEVRIVDLKGKMATYHVENKTVEVNNVLSFTNVSQVENWHDEEIKVLMDKIEDIKGQAKETIKVIKKYL